MLLFVLYTLVIVFLLYIWFLWFKKYSNSSWIFLLVASIAWAMRFFSYIIIYSFLIDKEILLYIFRFMYLMSIFWFYSMVIFVHKFWIKILEISKALYLLIFSIIFYIFVLTPLVVIDLKYIEDKKYFFEIYWQAYDYIIFAYLILIILFVYVSFLKLKILTYINKSRLKIIIFWFTIFMLLSMFFYLFLPYFGIFLLESLGILFLIPFVLSVIYSTKTYGFINFKIATWKIFVFILSISSSIISLYLSKYILSIFWEDFRSFWWISKNIWFFDLILVIILFLFFTRIFSKIFLWISHISSFEKSLFSLKNYIPYIPNLRKLNKFLKNNFSLLFKIEYLNIKLFKSKKSELYKYFSKDIYRNIFINDVVFIEENKYKFDTKKLEKELAQGVHLVFPIYNNKKNLIWIFELWEKPFKEEYYSEEIDLISSFVDFLSWHLKYIEIYSHINDLNINLDKKVDEKTIEYNNLISKQKEFISMSSHEIKTPVTSAQLQIECLLDDIKSWNYNKKFLLAETSMLGEHIWKISDLVKNIFSVQKYETIDVWLYLENTSLNSLIILECQVVARIYPEVKIDMNLSDSIWIVKLDKVQFNQVVSNLLNNAFKFSWKPKWKVKITSELSSKDIKITIEDNGQGFKNWEEKNIFEKYSTGKWKSVWLWMWLYLCKKIVELHWGIIKVKNSKSLWWASFEILIPQKVLK